MDENQDTNTKSGLLLYRGGTVCDEEFDQNSSDAICSAMGYSGINSSYKSGGSVLKDFRANRDITLNNVVCGSPTWDACSYSTSHTCEHSEDVFLECRGISNGLLSLLPSNKLMTFLKVYSLKFQD